MIPVTANRGILSTALVRVPNWALVTIYWTAPATCCTSILTVVSPSVFFTPNNHFDTVSPAIARVRDQTASSYSFTIFTGAVAFGRTLHLTHSV